MVLFKSRIHATGSPLPAPEPFRLQVAGPRVAIQIEVPSPLAKRLTEWGKPIPQPLTGWGLIDTGATSTAVSASAMSALGVSPVGVASVGTAGGRHEQPVFPLKLSLVQVGLALEFSQVTGADLSGFDIIALLGRDILTRMMLIYDGPSSEYTIAF